MKMLYLIGLGLGDVKDITVKGLETIKRCNRVYLESYTSMLCYGIEKEQLTLPAGLSNPGNVCYANSYIQTLFHILPIRRILYEWHRPIRDEPSNRTRYEALEELQRLFARLQSSAERAVNPKEFLRRIGISVEFQEDAQEFSIFFLDRLDRVLAERQGEEKIQSLFKGKLRSIVKCHSCNTESIKECPFYDLPSQVKDCNNITDSLHKYLASERIDDYECEKCAMKRPADRKMELIELPRFLKLNLLRYVFERASNVRKKLSNTVHFPESLDLKDFLSAEQAAAWGQSGCRYELISVLVHQGLSANYGHFLARIREPIGRRWYTFNDEFVTPYYGDENYLNDAQNAYTLVYEREKDVERDPAVPNVPRNIDVSDRPIDTWKLRQMKNSLGDGGMRGLAACMRVKPNSSIIWLPSGWLINLMVALYTNNYENMIHAPDMSRHICQHGRLGRVRGLKAIDWNTAKELLEMLAVAPEPRTLYGSDYCSTCTMYDGPEFF